MGAWLSHEETEYTTWQKHHHEIRQRVRQLAKLFVKDYCSVEPGDFTSDAVLIVAAFDDYLKLHLSDAWFTSYLYNTTEYVRFQEIFSEYPHINLVNHHRHNIVTGVCLVKWPSNTNNVAKE